MEETTPSKKCKRRIEGEEEVEEPESRAKEDVQPGRIEGKPGEANHDSMSIKGEQGGQGSNQAIRGRDSEQMKLRPSHSQGEDRGRPGEAFTDDGGGQSRDEILQGGSSFQEREGNSLDDDN